MLWAARVSASPLAQALGVPLDGVGRIVVEPDRSISGHPDVCVIGASPNFSVYQIAADCVAKVACARPPASTLTKS